MPQEMSFAQALTEARQIIVQQSNRIKTDLEKLKALQETIATQAGTIADSDRQLKQKTAELEAAGDQIKTITAHLEESKVAREQAEAVVDRQGQRLTQMQETIAGLEKQLADQSAKFEQTTRELDGLRSQLPTQEDTEALAALTALLSAKKGAPAAKPIESPAQDGAAAA
jgi:septal ring factor EnvC (AmiA/AmiB activator)